MTIKDYDNELLHMAHDLAVRLLPAFENTKTGIPYPRVSQHISMVQEDFKSSDSPAIQLKLCIHISVCTWGTEPVTLQWSVGGNCTKLWWNRRCVSCSWCAVTVFFRLFPHLACIVPCGSVVVCFHAVWQGRALPCAFSTSVLYGNKQCCQ